MDPQALSGHYSGPFFDLVDETIDAEPGKPCVTFVPPWPSDCTCPPYGFDKNGGVEPLPQGTDRGCPQCHPEA